MDMEENSHAQANELRQLEAEHRRYAEQLETLLQKPYLSAEEQIEEIRLKKLKLHTKDQLTARRPSTQHPCNVA